MSQVGEARLRESFGAAFPTAGSVTTGVQQNARISKKSGQFPLLVFLPGLGMNIEVYTALLSDLASHGYVVLAINPTYEVFAATISKDKAVGFSSPGWFRPPVERIIEYERGRLVVWATDKRRCGATLTCQFSIDVTPDAFLGHSDGRDSSHPEAGRAKSN
jgi:hypothetical protein